jgi:hypothetical protein
MSAEAFKIPWAIDVCQMFQDTHRERYDDHADSEVTQGAAVRCKPAAAKGRYPSGYGEDADEPHEVSTSAMQQFVGPSFMSAEPSASRLVEEELPRYRGVRVGEMQRCDHGG